MRTRISLVDTKDPYKIRIMMLLLSLLLCLFSLSIAALHIGLVVPGHYGHLNPAACLGTALNERGHRVTLISTPQPASLEVASRHNLPFLPIGIPEYEAGLLQVDLEHEGRLRGLKAFRHTIRLFKREEKLILRDLPSLLRKHKLDALCVDQLLPAAMDVAEVHHLPFGVLCNALPLHLDPLLPPFVTTWKAVAAPGSATKPKKKRRALTKNLRKVRNQVANLGIIAVAAPLYITLNRYRRKNGLKPHRMKTAQSVGNIQLAQIPEFVDFERSKLPDHFFYCAPWHSPQRDVSIPFPWHQLDGRPILYVSLGTVQNRLQHLYYLLAQSCPDNMQLVMAMGRMDAQDQANALAVGVPANSAIVSNYAPQTELLPRAAVVVTHGGMNTALECLKLGKPMVIVPLCNDQPGVAARLHRLGVCAVVKSNQAHRKDVLTRAILKVSSTPSYQQSANRISERINKECPTIHETAELLEVGLSRSTPLSRGDFYEFARRISMEQPADDVTMSSPEWDRVQKTTVVLR